MRLSPRSLPTLALTLVGTISVLSAGLFAAASLPVTRQQLTGYRSCVLTGVAASSTVAVDAWVQEDTPTINRGNTQELNVRGASGTRRRSFVRFDLGRCIPTVPASATVVAARLRLFATAIPTSNVEYAAFRVTTPCPEGLAGCWGEGTITWNNQPAFSATPTARTTMCAAASCNNVYYEWDVKADVAAFIAGTAPNYGWQVREAVETTANLVRFRSKKGNRAEEGPALVIVYT